LKDRITPLRANLDTLADEGKRVEHEIESLPPDDPPKALEKPDGAAPKDTPPAVPALAKPDGDGAKKKKSDLLARLAALHAEIEKTGAAVQELTERQAAAGAVEDEDRKKLEGFAAEHSEVAPRAKKPESQ
jgi:hypothetical protein